MTRINGRPFAFLAMMLAGWIGARVWMAADITALPPPPPSTNSSTAAAIVVPEVAGPAASFSVQRRALPNADLALGSAEPLRWRLAGLWEPEPEVAVPTLPLLEKRAAIDLREAPTLMDIAAPATAPQKYLDIYAYSFWRFADGPTGLAGAGQYGGSQSGLIALWDLGVLAPPLRGKRISLLSRLSVAHDRKREREDALGLRWQPLADIPVSLSAEQRFRPYGRDRVAVYAAGGVDGQPLPAGIHLDVYGQAGWVSGRDGGWFFDGSAHAQRRLPAIDDAVVTSAGAGLWTGGQRGAQRLDIGPSIRTDLKLGKLSARVSADWRFRVAGDAAPGSGPAVTLSTAF